MLGIVATLRVKPGMEAEFETLARLKEPWLVLLTR